MKTNQTEIQKEVRTAVTKYLNALEDNQYATSSLYAELIAQVEESLFNCVMTHTERNISLSSNILGISRTTLRKKLKHYNIIE